MTTSKNNRAKRVVGMRIGSGYTDLVPNFCPLCGAGLKLSEYNHFIWCPSCDIDMPEILCYHPTNVEQIKVFTNRFLDTIEEVQTKYIPLKDYMEDVQARTNLAYCIINLLKHGEMEFRTFRFMLYKLYRDLEEQGIDIKLPHYWYIDGPHIGLMQLPAVFKLRVKKSTEDPKIYKVTILLDKRIKFNDKKNLC